MNQDIEKGYAFITQWLAENTCFTEAEKDNVRDSASRAARGMQEMLWTIAKISEEVSKALETMFPVSTAAGFPYKMPIALNSVMTNSLCPHHLLPITNEVCIAYLQSDKALGLSKIARIADALARRPVIQEQYTRDLVNVLTHGVVESISFGNGVSSDVGARVKAKHLCMVCRGVEDPTALTTTYHGSGAFSGEAGLKYFTTLIAGQ